MIVEEQELPTEPLSPNLQKSPEKEILAPRSLVQDLDASVQSTPYSRTTTSLNRSYSFLEKDDPPSTSLHRSYSLENTLSTTSTGKGKASVWDNLAQLNAKFDSACRKKKKTRMESDTPLSGAAGPTPSLCKKEEEEELVFMGSIPSRSHSGMKKEVQQFTVVDLTGDAPKVIRPPSPLPVERPLKVGYFMASSYWM
jgi:hypothetical protein